LTSIEKNLKMNLLTNHLDLFKKKGDNDG